MWLYLKCDIMQQCFSMTSHCDKKLVIEGVINYFDCSTEDSNELFNYRTHRFECNIMWQC